MKHSWRSPCVNLSLVAAAGRDSSDQPALQSNDLWDWIWNFQKSNRKRRWLTPSQGRDLVLYYNTLLHKPVRNGYKKQTFLKSSAISHSPEGLLFPLLKMFITSLNEPDPPPPHTPHCSAFTPAFFSNYIVQHLASPDFSYYFFQALSVLKRL